MDTWVELLANFRDKSFFFHKTCCLLVMLCRDLSVTQGRENEGILAQDILNVTEIVEDIESVHNIAERNHQLEGKRSKIKSKGLFVSQCQPLLVSTRLIKERNPTHSNGSAVRTLSRILWKQWDCLWPVPVSLTACAETGSGRTRRMITAQFVYFLNKRFQGMFCKYMYTKRQMFLLLPHQSLSHCILNHIIFPNLLPSCEWSSWLLFQKIIPRYIFAKLLWYSVW